jgi:nucleoside 2-deoxyribosyltransferase
LQIFLAAPLFSEAERDFNSRVAEALRKQGFEVWLAQEHKFVEDHSNMEKKAIFREDLDAIKKGDLILAVLDGVDVDSGVAFEMGFAYANGKPMVGLKTDHRVFSRVESVNLMLEAPISKLCKTLAEAIEVLKACDKHNGIPERSRQRLRI